MICKFFKSGYGKIEIGYNYNEDYHGFGNCKTIHGNRNVIEKLIDMSSTKNKYTSGVLSFSETISDDMELRIIDFFNYVFMPGISTSRYKSLWVEHTTHLRTEMHFIIFRQDLITGKVITPYLHRKDNIKLNLFQSIINSYYKLKSPTISLLTLENQKTYYRNHKRIKNEKKEKLARSLHEKIKTKIELGIITNKLELVDYLYSNYSKINYKNKQFFIEVESETIRLSGPIYREEYNSIDELINKIDLENRYIRISGNLIDKNDYNVLFEYLEKIVQNHAVENLKLFGNTTSEWNDFERERFFLHDLEAENGYSKGLISCESHPLDLRTEKIIYKIKGYRQNSVSTRSRPSSYRNLR